MSEKEDFINWYETSETPKSSWDKYRYKTLKGKNQMNVGQVIEQLQKLDSTCEVVIEAQGMVFEFSGAFVGQVELDEDDMPVLSENGKKVVVLSTDDSLYEV